MLVPILAPGIATHRAAIPVIILAVEVPWPKASGLMAGPLGVAFVVKTNLFLGKVWDLYPGVDGTLATFHPIL